MSNDFIISSSTDGTVRLWNCDTGSCLRSISLGAEVYCCRFQPSNNNMFVCGTAKCQLHVFNVSTGKSYKVMLVYPRRCVSVCLSVCLCCHVSVCVSVCLCCHVSVCVSSVCLCRSVLSGGQFDQPCNLFDDAILAHKHYASA